VACLPSETTRLTFQQSTSMLATLHDKPMCKMSSCKSQAEINSIAELVAGMAKGLSPSAKIADAGGAYAMAMTAFPWFFHGKLDVKGKSVTMYGQPALVKSFEALKADMAGKKQVTMQQVEALLPFQWLLSATQVEELTAWRAKLAEQGLQRSSAAPAGPSGSSSSSACAVKKKTSVLNNC